MANRRVYKLSNNHYEFPVLELKRVVDGDTFWLEIETGNYYVDVGFREKAYISPRPKTLHCRLRGVDTWETRGVSEAHREKGRLATVATTKWLGQRLLNNMPLIAKTFKAREWDNFGRVLIEVWQVSPSDSLGDYLKREGHTK